MLASRFPADAALQALVPLMLDFLEWLHTQQRIRVIISLRDLIAWTDFILIAAPRIGVYPAYMHGACMIVLDGVGLGASLSEQARLATREAMFAFLFGQLPAGALAVEGSDVALLPLVNNTEMFGVQGFTIPRGPHGYTLRLIGWSVDCVVGFCIGGGWR